MKTVSWIDYVLFGTLGALVAFLLFGHTLLHLWGIEEEHNAPERQTEQAILPS